MVCEVLVTSLLLLGFGDEVPEVMQYKLPVFCWSAGPYYTLALWQGMRWILASPPAKLHLCIIFTSILNSSHSFTLNSSAQKASELINRSIIAYRIYVLPSCFQYKNNLLGSRIELVHWELVPEDHRNPRDRYPLYLLWLYMAQMGSSSSSICSKNIARIIWKIIFALINKFKMGKKWSHLLLIK